MTWLDFSKALNQVVVNLINSKQLNMKSTQELKDIVRNKYAQIANQQIAVNKASCCGSMDPSKEVYNIMTDNYGELDGYSEEADLGLGCGLPTEFAKIEKGDTVIDLGSGAGNDVFIARHETGPEGRVLGIDFTPEMIKKARTNALKLGFNNVEFRQGDIEDMPVGDHVADVVVSNCVLNLLPSKDKIFNEIYRVLKDNGHFSISDIVLDGDIPDNLKESAEMYAGCVAGAIQKDDYMQKIVDAGFHNITLQKEKEIFIPDDILTQYLSDDEIAEFRASSSAIKSITVFASKSKHKRISKVEELNTIASEACCEPGSSCC